MKLLSVTVEDAATCGGLLNGLDVRFAHPSDGRAASFEPTCLLGRNGAGKSQFLQLLAEIFQSGWRACSESEERAEANPGLLFKVEYLIWPDADRGWPDHIRLERHASRRGKPPVLLSKHTPDGWQALPLDEHAARTFLPSRIVGYTSGENETLSLPFFTSRMGYAQDVAGRALTAETSGTVAPEPRLMLIDYATHLEVLVANLILGSTEQRSSFLEDVGLSDLRSVRCVVQLAHKAVGAAPAHIQKRTGRKGVQLTAELAELIDRLKRCSTCWEFQEKHERFVFDLWVDDETRSAFGHFYKDAFELYRALHKLALLNDLAISRVARQRFEAGVRTRRFASRLPEPPDEDKVFRFEQVTFQARSKGKVQTSVDYVSLSDGEHQMMQIRGVFSMISEPNVLFLLDEPESHFNPHWRVAFLSKLLDVPTGLGPRRSGGECARQEVLLTTHAPFVPSDMPREHVLIFERNGSGGVTPRRPDIQTFGASYEEILEHCFRVEPPISELSRQMIDELMSSTDIDDVQKGLGSLGPSVEKVFLADHLSQLKRS